MIITHYIPRNFSSKHSQITAIGSQVMDSRLSFNVKGVPIISTMGRLLSKPYQPCLTLSTSTINGIERKDGFAVSIKNHVKLGPKLLDIVKHKLSYGAKILPIGRDQGRIFSKNFTTVDCEKLLHASRCCIYTTSGAIAGSLFISTERVGFCSDRALKTYSATGELLKFQYKVSIPLGKLKGVDESINRKKPSNKYVELVTVDDFSFWFLGFPNYKKTLRYIRQTIGHKCLRN